MPIGKEDGVDEYIKENKNNEPIDTIEIDGYTYKLVDDWKNDKEKSLEELMSEIWLPRDSWVDSIRITEKCDKCWSTYYPYRQEWVLYF